MLTKVLVYTENDDKNLDNIYLVAQQFHGAEFLRSGNEALFYGLPLSQVESFRSSMQKVDGVFMVVTEGEYTHE